MNDNKFHVEIPEIIEIGNDKIFNYPLYSRINRREVESRKEEAKNENKKWSSSFIYYLQLNIINLKNFNIMDADQNDSLENSYYELMKAYETASMIMTFAYIYGRKPADRIELSCFVTSTNNTFEVVTGNRNNPILCNIN